MKIEKGEFLIKIDEKEAWNLIVSLERTIKDYSVNYVKDSNSFDEYWEKINKDEGLRDLIENTVLLLGLTGRSRDWIKCELEVFYDTFDDR